MSTTAYEILALTAKYWFVFLIGYILYRTIENAFIEYRYDKSMKREQRGEGYLGFLKIIACKDEESELLNRQYELEKDNLIGRSQKCDIVIPQRTVSGTHANIYQKGSQFFIRDLRSRNGTYVNEKKVKSKEKINDGDIIQLGGIIFSLKIFE